MKITDNLSLPSLGAAAKRPQTREEAAQQFELLLARKLVQSMTDGLFKSSLAGEDGPAWMSSLGDTRRDLMTDVLSEHLAESGQLGFSDLLLRRWRETMPADEAPTAPAPDAAREALIPTNDA